MTLRRAFEQKKHELEEESKVDFPKFKNYLTLEIKKEIKGIGHETKSVEFYISSFFTYHVSKETLKEWTDIIAKQEEINIELICGKYAYTDCLFCDNIPMWSICKHCQVTCRASF